MDALGDPRGVAVVAQRLHQNPEFIARDTRHAVDGAYRYAHARRDFLDHLLRGLVSEAALDIVELVDRHGHHGHVSLGLARGAHQCLSDAVEKQLAVGELRHRIMQRILAQCVGDRLLLRELKAELELRARHVGHRADSG
jgi:hypothetical protein